jgi:hypothetical protein
MTFTNVEILEQKHRVEVLQYLYEGRQDEHIKALNLVNQAADALNAATDKLNYMKLNKENK